MYKPFKIAIEMFIYPISFITPRNKKIWIFGAWAGKAYSENPKYMFEYVNQNHKDIRAVWISRNKKIVERLQNKGYESYYYLSLKGILIALRAGACFESEGNTDVCLYTVGRAKVIQLWHGMPFKKIGNDAVGWKNLTSVTGSDKWRHFINQPEKSYYMVASEKMGEIMQSAWNAHRSRIFVTGFPHNDMYVPPIPSFPYLEQLKKNNPGCKVVLYMPTHRNFGSTGKPQFTIEDLKSLNVFLKEHGIYMIFKPHIHEMKNYLHFENELSHIIFANDPDIFGDPYEYSPSCDALITDYSSIFIDFLGLNRPIIFFPYDLDYYVTQDAGLYFDYENTVPGPIAYNWEQVTNALDEQLKCDSYEAKRLQCRQFLNPYNDGQNRKRIYSQVLKIMKIDN